MLAILASLLAAPAPDHCASAKVRTREVSFTVTRTAVVACGRVVHRARLIEPVRGRPRGAIIGGAAAAGRRVVWIETRFRDRRRIVELVTARGPAIRRRLLRRNASPLVPRVDVVSTRRGELAWLAPGSRSSSNRVVLDRPGRPPRTIARAVVTDLAVDGGSTLRWSAYGRRYGFYDLPRPHRPPCPRRKGYAVVAENAELRVTRRVYQGEDDIDVAVVRACVRGEGPDRVLAQADMFGGQSVGLAGVEGTVLVLVESSVNFRVECVGGTLLTAIEARTAKRLRETWMPWCGEDPGAAYTTAAPTAVTSDGVIAWLVVYDATERLLVAGPDGTPDELDRGPPGTIADLDADGERIAWSHGGEPRSVDPP